ncbi:MAG: DUF5990 family protein [Myxococcota bacterium]
MRSSRRRRAGAGARDRPGLPPAQARGTASRTRRGSGRKDGDPPAVFWRAKLRLDAVPADVLAEALRTGVLAGELDLTDAEGMPLCASVRPPAIRWSAGP